MKRKIINNSINIEVIGDFTEHHATAISQAITSASPYDRSAVQAQLELVRVQIEEVREQSRLQLEAQRAALQHQVAQARLALEQQRERT